MQSNLTNEIKQKQPLRDQLAADVERAIANGVTVQTGEPYGVKAKDLPAPTPILTQKKRLTMKDVVKRFKRGSNGKN